MNAKRRLWINRIVLGLAILAIVVGLVIYTQWNGVWLNATLL